MSIFDKQQDKSKKFAKVTKGKTKEEVRVAEEHLLKPENIPEYTGDSPKHKSELASRCALIVFKNQAQQDVISEIFAVRTSVSGDTYKNSSIDPNKPLKDQVCWTCDKILFTRGS